ncbi:MAG: choice-of-anchor L domain-containing protein [Bacteroidales bacterium]
MKKFFSLLFILGFITVYAQERNADPAKQWDISKENDCEGFSLNFFDEELVTADTLITKILGDDIQSYSILNSQAATGQNASAGIFNGGNAAGINLESGIILSSGFIKNVTGPNEYSGVTGVLNLPGDEDMEALIPGYETLDATILEFSFIPVHDTLFISFVFGSDEYNEWVGSPYNDVFGFFLNGENIALVPETNDRISVNSINNFSNNNFFINNDERPGLFCNEMDGFTTLLTAIGIVSPGELNHIKLAIADAGDRSFDSWVFIKSGGFTGIDPGDPDDDDPVPLPLKNWPIFLIMIMILVFTFIKIRRSA